jgi:hypothetical protein
MGHRESSRSDQHHFPADANDISKSYAIHIKAAGGIPNHGLTRRGERNGGRRSAPLASHPTCRSCTARTSRPTVSGAGAQVRLSE